MNDQEAVADIMNKIKIMQEYKDKYGEEDINEYVVAHGTYKGIDNYLMQKTLERKNAENTSNV